MDHQTINHLKVGLLECWIDGLVFFCGGTANPEGFLGSWQRRHGMAKRWRAKRFLPAIGFCGLL
jgi:hypothetical protein